MVNGILIGAERVLPRRLFVPPLRRRIVVNTAAPSQFVFLNALLKPIRLRSRQNW